jgi:excisionase family DNA binding protein
MPRLLTVEEVSRLTRLLTVEEVSRITGWRPATIRQKVWRRELPYIKLGRSVRFKEETITRLIEASEVPALEQR